MRAEAAPGLRQHPSDESRANTACQLISGLTHNLIRLFQLYADAPARKNARKRTHRFVLQWLRTLRFELIHLPAKLVRPSRRPRLPIPASAKGRERVTRVLDALEAVA